MFRSVAGRGLIDCPPNKVLDRESFPGGHDFLQLPLHSGGQFHRNLGADGPRHAIVTKRRTIFKHKPCVSTLMRARMSIDVGDSPVLGSGSPERAPRERVRPALARNWTNPRRSRPSGPRWQRKAVGLPMRLRVSSLTPAKPHRMRVCPTIPQHPIRCELCGSEFSHVSAIPRHSVVVRRLQPSQSRALAQGGRGSPNDTDLHEPDSRGGSRGGEAERVPILSRRKSTDAGRDIRQVSG